MLDLTVFTNEEFGEVRTMVIEGEPWFVGKDVAASLGYAEPRSAISKKVDAEDKGVAEMATPSGKQKMTIINESGLYSLIFGSKLESATRFKVNSRNNIPRKRYEEAVDYVDSWTPSTNTKLEIQEANCQQRFAVL